MEETIKKRICNICEDEFPETSEYFYKSPSTPHGFEYRCKGCKNSGVLARKKTRRKTDAGRAYDLWAVYKKTDKIKGLTNDLTPEIILEMVSDGCIYCGDTNRIGLDRLDNNIGTPRGTQFRAATIAIPPGMITSPMKRCC